MKRQLLAWTVAATWIAGGAARQAAAQDEAASDEQIDQRLKIAERKLELGEEQKSEKEKATPVVVAAADGFTLKSANGDFQLKLRGYVQTDGRFYFDDDERPLTDTWVIRRARPVVEGTLYKIFDFKIMPDFGSGTTVLQDAYMDARFSPLASVRAGKFKPPVGIERLQSARELLFVERSLPTNLVPNRDLGLMLYGEAAGGAITYQVGAFNGVSDGGSADSDVNRGKEGAGRVFAIPFKSTKVLALQSLGLGVSATYGLSEGTTSANGLAGYRTAAQQTFFSYRSNGTVAGTVLADGRRTRISPQLYWYVGRFGLLAEQVTSSQELQRDGTPAELTNRAWQASVSFLLTGEAATYLSVSPRKPFDPPNSGIGAFEIAARAGALRVDEDAFPLFSDPAASAEVAREWAGAFNWYLNRSVRFMLDYAQTRFVGGSSTGNREDERVLLTRMQIAF
jgi:phosphate-selective porin OprO/OprP